MKIATLLAVGVLLAGCGAASQATPTTVTSTVTTTTTTTRAVTPDACLKALDEAEEVVGYAHDVIDSAARAVQAAAGLDAAGIDAETSKVQKINPKMKRVTDAYDVDSAACRVGTQ